MRYELLLQTSQAGLPYEVAKVDAALAARGVTDRGDGFRVWKLKAGEVEVRAVVEGGTTVATELRVPLSDKLDLIRELVQQGAALAEEAGARLYDPQLSRTLGAQDDGVVANSFLATARYAGEMMGVPEAVFASFGPPETGLKPGTKVALGLIGLVAVVWFVVDALFSR
ncbi:MAG: hypothetical protein IRZ16_10810 [Myxococcaceae bacterium]|nr:hypothetical protein [Myxococcaceae bacterium]